MPQSSSPASRGSGPLRGSQNYVWYESDALGHGATATVYRCREKKTGLQYAVKMFNPQSHARPQDVKVREFDVLKKLDHDNIVRLLTIEVEQITNAHVIVMELCTGGSLYNILDSPVNAYGLEEDEFLLVLQHVAAGMKHLRDKSIIHRDIKPGNILKYIAEDGTSIYKLTDFGAARELDDEQQFMSLYGTEEYLHPDMYSPAVLRQPLLQQFGASVDLWSLGVTFYHVATGQLPFRPFGGRKNKKKMFEITTKKASGVISGVQSTEGGNIEWGRELPKTCRLSLGLRNLITPVLARLLEGDPQKSMTFDQLFEFTSSLDEKMVIYVFSACTGSSISVYIGKNESYAKFQDLLAEQTDIKAECQHLLYENQPLQTIVHGTQTADTYPPTSQDMPIFLYNKEFMEFPKLTVWNIPKFPVPKPGLNLSEDYAFTKSCCGVLHHIKRQVQLYMAMQKLIHRSVKMYTCVILNDTQHIKDYVDHFTIKHKETQKRFEYFKDSYNMHGNMWKNMFSRTVLPQNVMESQEQIEKLKNRIDRSIPTQKTLDEEMSTVNHYTKDYYLKIVVNNDFTARWNDKLGCIESDRCKSKVNHLVDLVTQTMAEFKRDRENAKSLTYNDEQIHKFEKNRLEENCAKAMSVVTEHCYKNLKTTYKKFAEWFEMGCKVRYKISRLESEVTKKQKSHNDFTKMVDKVQMEYQVHMGIIGDFAYRKNPKTGSLPTRNEQMARFNPNPSFTINSPLPEESIGTLINVQRGVDSIQSDTIKVTKGVHENNELLERLKNLQMKNTEMDNGLAPEPFISQTPNTS
ncbi:unnamed protein product [Owenia fusiformis]|uniref:Uncharacterized protein n=1 Tax=Owenia fusiformis TaxID=6347 RepID=A0A8J1T690_OWEFU|nr:unnamed protein product [Owenia fusiformis]